jgi:hypothetical protein
MPLRLLPLLLVALTVLGPGRALAQERDQTIPPNATTTREASPGLRLPLDFSAAAQRPFPRAGHHGLNLKGLIIGGAVGAGLGLWLCSQACDGGDTGSEYLAAMAGLGGLGAALGAFAEHNHTPAMPSRDHRIRIGARVTPTRKQASATFAF